MLSIVIPCYNDTDTLTACLTPYWEYLKTGMIELVLVNDGGDAEALENFVATHCAEAVPPVKLIHQSHAGASVARNRGLEAAQADFVWFVDADDVLAPHTMEWLEPCLCTMDDDSDIVKLGPLVLDNERWPFADVDQSDEVPVEKILDERFGALDHTTYIFRRTFLMDKGLRYPEHHALLEDSAFVLDALQYVDHLFFNPTYCYYCYKVHRSIRGPWSREEQQERLKDIVWFFDLFRKTVEKDSKFASLFDHFFCRHLRILTVKGYSWRDLCDFRHRMAVPSTFYYGKKSLAMRLFQCRLFHYLFFLVCQLWIRTSLYKLRRHR